MLSETKFRSVLQLLSLSLSACSAACRRLLSLTEFWVEGVWQEQIGPNPISKVMLCARPTQADPKGLEPP